MQRPIDEPWAGRIEGSVRGRKGKEVFPKVLRVQGFCEGFRRRGRLGCESCENGGFRLGLRRGVRCERWEDGGEGDAETRLRVGCFGVDAVCGPCAHGLCPDGGHGVLLRAVSLLAGASEGPYRTMAHPGSLLFDEYSGVSLLPRDGRSGN